MPKLSVSKAAKMFDVSRPTLQKALKDGTITGEKVTAGGSESWEIDTAELARLYKLRNPEPDNMPRQEDESGQHLATEKTGENAGLSPELVRELESRLQAAQTELDQLRASKAEAEINLAKAQATAEERLRMLNNMKLIPKDEDQVQRKTLWQRLLGGR